MRWGYSDILELHFGFDVVDKTLTVLAGNRRYIRWDGNDDRTVRYYQEEKRAFYLNLIQDLTSLRFSA